jgi:mono/diheme cytochrome c family protein
MRERLARWVALLTATVTVALALWFAWIHNPPLPALPAVAPGAPPAAPAAALAEAGRAVYGAQHCASCHAIAGVGSPRYPLDGVGRRHDAQAMAAWIVGAPEVADALPASAVRRKQRYAELAPHELEALVAYLLGLRD